jgi:hypothetical protein
VKNHTALDPVSWWGCLIVLPLTSAHTPNRWLIDFEVILDVSSCYPSGRLWFHVWVIFLVTISALIESWFSVDTTNTLLEIYHECVM